MKMGVVEPQPAPDPSKMVEKWVKPVKSSNVFIGVQVPRRQARLTKALPVCAKGLSSQAQGPCRVPEKILPYCTGGKSSRPCRPIEALPRDKKTEFRDTIPPQYRLNPPTLKKDILFQVPEGHPQEIMWDLFKTDVIPVTNFPFMTGLRSRFSDFEYEEYCARRDDRLDEETEKLWQASWKGKVDTGLLGPGMLDKDRAALKKNETLYASIRKKLDETPVSKGAVPKLPCRPLRLVEPFAAESDIYFRNLARSPEEENEHFVMPKTSPKTLDTDDCYPPGHPPKSKFYSSLDPNLIEFDRPEPIPEPDPGTYNLILTPEDFYPMVHRVRKFEQTIEQEFARRHQAVPVPASECPDIVRILDSEVEEGHDSDRITEAEVESAEEADEIEGTLLDWDADEETAEPGSMSSMTPLSENVVESMYEKGKEILNTMKRKGYAADESLKARMMELRMNKDYRSQAKF